MAEPDEARKSNFGAGNGDRTRISSLENWNNNHYTIPAYLSAVALAQADARRIGGLRSPTPHSRLHYLFSR